MLVVVPSADRRDRLISAVDRERILSAGSSHRARWDRLKLHQIEAHLTDTADCPFLLDLNAAG